MAAGRSSSSSAGVGFWTAVKRELAAGLPELRRWNLRRRLIASFWLGLAGTVAMRFPDGADLVAELRLDLGDPERWGMFLEFGGISGIACAASAFLLGPLLYRDSGALWPVLRRAVTAGVAITLLAFFFGGFFYYDFTPSAGDALHGTPPWVWRPVQALGFALTAALMPPVMFLGWFVVFVVCCASALLAVLWRYAAQESLPDLCRRLAAYWRRRPA